MKLILRKFFTNKMAASHCVITI